ncbi:MAG TPA: TIGR00269 family protein [Candidatus Thermoplasmatota archaeon]|nr:TIGR00269 family protein [Candidatus Thermoplasmatota archaeon]
MPPCSKCPGPAVTFLRYAGAHLCRAHFLQSFERRAKAEVARQGGLPEGRVAVALSGGKDSVAALHFLRKLTRDHPRVELAAVTIDEGIAGYRDSALAICEEVTQRLGVPWHVVRTQDLAGYTIDQRAAATGGAVCGPCGVFRRVGMNRLARELGASAIATGHNLDDQAQTILMNHLKGDLDRLARLAPHTAEDARRHAGLVPRLLPFRSIPEKEVLLYALLEGLPIHDEAECPYAARSHRFALRDVLMGLEEQTPGTRHALVRGQERLKPILQAALPPVAVASCPACGEPTSGASCTACSMKA